MHPTILRPRPKALPVALAVGLLWWPSASAAAEETTEPRLVEVADGVWAMLQAAESRFDDCNSAFLVGRHDVLVVDPPSTPGASRFLLEAIAERTDLPVRWIVNTHWHGDHTEGNREVLEAFGPEVRIVGHDNLRSDVVERAAAAHAERVARTEALLPRARQQLIDGLRRDGSPLSEADRAVVRAGIENAERWLEEHARAEFVPPSITYGDRLTLYRGRRTIRVLHLRGHTRGDTALFLEEDSVLIAGDLVDELPYVGHGYPSEWLAGLRRLAALEPRLIVPGHGPLFRGSERLELTADYLAALVSRAEAAVGAGESLDELLETTDLSRWRESLASDERAAAFFDAVRDEAIARAFAEAQGESRRDRRPIRLP